VSLIKRGNAIKNTITAILDEYFPEIWTVFKNPLKGKASRHVLRNCPFPVYILAKGEEGVLAEIKKAVKRRRHQESAALIAAAEGSVGVRYGLKAAKMRLCWLLDDLKLDRETAYRIGASNGTSAS
jgi:hypothetical protein